MDTVSSAALPFVAPGAAPSAAALDVPAHLLELEAAHAALRRAAVVLTQHIEPTFDLRPAARALERTFALLYDAWDARADPLQATRAAINVTAVVSAALAPGAGEPAVTAASAQLAEARRHLQAAETRLARIPPPAPPPAGEVLASADVPRLHRIARPSLAPLLRVPEPPAPPPTPPPELTAPAKTFDELRETIAKMKERAKARRPAVVPPPAISAPAPGAQAKAAPAAQSDDDFRRARAREHFEEIAMVGMQRAPMAGEPWRNALGLERRMLAAIDVLAALGPVAAEHLPRLWADAPVKDPMHGFALAMALGCFAGRDALAAGELALFGGERDAELCDQVGAALKLVPHDALPLALRSLLRDPDPAIRATAIDVLGYRGLATQEELHAAARDAPPVAARALSHLAAQPSPSLIPLIDEIGEPADPALRRARWTAMAMAAHPRASEVLRAALPDAEAGDAAALLLAIAGDERDAREIVDRMVLAPRPGLVAAVGWSGAGWALDRLVDLLEHGDEECRAAAGEALARITGAWLIEEVEVPAEEIHIQEPAMPDVGEPRKPKLAQIVSDPRDLPPPPAAEKVERASTDPARWRAWLREHEADFGATGRYRRGKPYTPLMSLQELDAWPCGVEERRLLQRELAARTGGFVRFDPHDLVVVQEQALRAWEPIARRASAAPGQWSRPYR